MKFFCCFLFAVLATLSSGASFTTTASPATETTIQTAHLSAVANLTVKELQEHLGRKLTMKEKVQWYFAKKLIHKITNEEEEALAKKARTKAYMGFGFSLAGLLLFPLLAIPGIIFSGNALAFDKEHPGKLGDAKGFAKAGQIMGWISLALLVIVLILVILFLSAWGWR